MLRRLPVRRARRQPRRNGNRLQMPAPSPSRVAKTSMMMNLLSRVRTSRTSTVRMVPRMLRRQKAGGRLGVAELLLDNVAGVIAAVVAVLVVDRAAAEIAVLSSSFKG